MFPLQSNQSFIDELLTVWQNCLIISRTGSSSNTNYASMSHLHQVRGSKKKKALKTSSLLSLPQDSVVVVVAVQVVTHSPLEVR